MRTSPLLIAVLLAGCRASVGGTDTATKARASTVAEPTIRADTVLPGVANAWANTVAISAWAQSHGMPSFNDFLVDDTASIRPVPVNLVANPSAQRMRTRLRQGAAEGPNFAGGFTVVSWGCGSPCVQFAIIAARTGRVHMYDQPWVRPPLFRRDSRLLIEDPTGFMTDSLGHPKLASMVRYYEWTGDSLVVRDSLDAQHVRLQ